MRRFGKEEVVWKKKHQMGFCKHFMEKTNVYFVLWNIRRYKLKKGWCVTCTWWINFLQNGVSRHIIDDLPSILFQTFPALGCEETRKKLKTPIMKRLSPLDHFFTSPSKRNM